MRLADVLDLLRVPNALTALSDIAAAAAVGAATRPGEPPSWLPLVLVGGASAALYLGGMALNDVADLESDQVGRPTRPLPSGRLTRGRATAITAALFLAGLGLAALAGRGPLLVAAVLLAAILSYDLALAGRPLWGPLGMATCRGLNWLLGLWTAGAVAWTGLAGLTLVFLYILGLTHLSLGEVRGHGRAPVGLAILSTLAAVLGTMLLGRTVLPHRPAFGWGLWLVPLLIAASRTCWALGRAWIRPEPSRVGPAVGSLVTNLLWLDAALALAVLPVRQAGPWLGLFVLLATVQEILRRRYPVT